ncbi:MAG: 23S rRNA (uracil(1939)-C(5))-methyltransferase RlmD [Geobacter sp.]|nr:23S rRNA (uracil(1939)-C(5))-methyltransferase RlmD [Geobacter sp.]
MTSTIATIDKLSYGGSGVCRIEGKVCFVPFSCPGDQVSLRMTVQKKSYSTAEIIENLQPSLDRVEPLCPIFGSCGGCNWQHVKYQVQLEQKLQIFIETLWRGARVEGDRVGETAASPLQYGYRSRVQFKVSYKGGKLCIGFYRTGSHVVEDAVTGCPIAMPRVNEILSRFRSALKNFSDLEHIEQISVDVGEHLAVAVIHYTGNSIKLIKSFLDNSSGNFGSCTGLFLQRGKDSKPEMIWGNARIDYSMPNSDSNLNPIFLSYTPGGFAQINQSQNVAILSIIRRFADFKTTDRLLDLYCGNGNFSIPLSFDVASVFGIEGSANSIQSARRNKEHNLVSNIEFECSDVKKAIERLLFDNHSFDVVLLDPPRNGAGDVVSDIARLNPAKIIYVSCDPGTLARDCGQLETHGYRVVESIPLDMFPQTFHLESVTLLIKK